MEIERWGGGKGDIEVLCDGIGRSCMHWFVIAFCEGGKVVEKPVVF